MKKTIAIMVLLGALGCARHENLPTAYNYEQPPTPTNFEVQPGSAVDYDLTWDISDSLLVDHYNVYYFLFNPTPEFAGTVPGNATSVNVVTGFQLPGLEFGIAAVTSQNVEGEIVSAFAP